MTQLYQNYMFRRRGFKAADALRLARLDMAEGRTRYYSPEFRYYAGNWQPPSQKQIAEAIDREAIAWAKFFNTTDTEGRKAVMRANAATGYLKPLLPFIRWDSRPYYAPDWPAGWRLVGRADEVAPRSIDHKGWFTEDDGDTGTLAGYVLRLPHGRLVAATRHSEDDGVTLYPLDSFDDEAECARAADGYAEIAAEKERDYQRGWRAGCNAAELERENKELRQSILQICADLKVFGDLPVSRQEEESRSRLCGLARGKVTELLATIHRNRARRDKLRDKHYGTAEGYRSGYAEG